MSADKVDPTRRVLAIRRYRSVLILWYVVVALACITWVQWGASTQQGYLVVLWWFKLVVLLVVIVVLYLVSLLTVGVLFRAGVRPWIAILVSFIGGPLIAAGILIGMLSLI